MKRICRGLIVLFLALAAFPMAAGTDHSEASLKHATQVIRDAFARGDVDKIVALHHPGIIKYFGGSNVITGRDELRKSLVEMFAAQQMTFVGNKVESTVFEGDLAIESSIFTIRFTPKNGGPPSIARGRALVTYVRSKESPTGWLTLREMTQAAPAE
jgi:ketosteroid isomerase-like protein